MKVRFLAATFFLGIMAGSSAFAASPAADFKSLMRKTLDAWQTLDPANAAPFYAKDADNIYFDIAPLKYTGWVEYADGVKKNFPDLASVKFTLGDDVRIHPHGNLAWATASLHFDLATKGGAATSTEGRWTLVWEKRGAKFGRRHGRDVDRAPLGRRASAARHPGQHQSDRIALLHPAPGHAQR